MSNILVPFPFLLCSFWSFLKLKFTVLWLPFISPVFLFHQWRPLLSHPYQSGSNTQLSYLLLVFTPPTGKYINIYLIIQSFQTHDHLFSFRNKLLCIKGLKTILLLGSKLLLSGPTRSFVPFTLLMSKQPLYWFCVLSIHHTIWLS